MSMTPHDLVKFEKLWQIIADWQTSKRDFSDPSISKPWFLRIENLEKITIFSLLCDKGEQGITGEQIECLKRIGMFDMWEKIVAELDKKQ